MFFAFLTANLVFNNSETKLITKVNSPVEFTIDKNIFKLKDFDTFDSYYTDKNKKLAITKRKIVSHPQSSHR